MWGSVNETYGEGALWINRSNERFSQCLDPLLSESNATAMFTQAMCPLRPTGEALGVEAAQ